MAGLRFDVDIAELEQMARDLNLQTAQIRAAMSRAISRTRGTLRAESARGLKAELGLRTTGQLRRRIRVRWIRKDQEIEVWYGENDFPLRAFAGRPKQTSDGVSFREHEFAGAFIGKPYRSGPRSVWQRRGERRMPVREVMMPVKDRMDVYIEDHVMDQAGELLLRYFAHEIRARGIFGVGQ